MKKIYIILIISFYLEALFTNYIKFNTYLNPLFSLTILIIINYIIHDKKKYYKLCIIQGILYDLIYTNTIFLHGFLFLIIGYIIVKIEKYLEQNHFNISVLGLIIIIIYRLSNYILLCIINSHLFSYSYLLKSITTSICTNIIYINLIYFLLQKNRVINKKELHIN